MNLDEAANRVRAEVDPDANIIFGSAFSEDLDGKIRVLGVGLVGITFSVMSASWDDDEEGSALGFDEFKTNFDSIKGGLKRTKQNAILREKMAGLPDAEIDQAIASLDKREDAARKKAMDLKEKLAKDLE